MEKVFDSKLLTSFLSDSSLEEYSNMKIGKRAHYFFTPKTVSDLSDIIVQTNLADLEILPIGGCSNMLFGNVGNRVIISDRYLPRIYTVNNNEVVVSSNYKIIDFMEEMKKYNLGGLEFLSGIPAHLGGIAHMNAGAFDNTISLFIKWVEVINSKGELQRIKASEINFCYRCTSVDDFIVNVCFELESKTKKQITNDMNEILNIRRERHPLEYPSLGSTFRNPEGHFAGLLIRDCGLAGKQIGGAQISDKHSNFIVNRGNAEFSDVVQLIELAKNEVKNKYGIDLKLEIKVIN